MVYATRGNRMIQIEEYNIPRYVEQGYNITGQSGEVLQNAVPTDVQVLKQSFTQHVEEIKGLKAKIAELEAKVAELEAAKAKPAPKKAEKPVVEPVEETSKVEEPSAEDIAKAEESLNRPRKSRASKSEK